MLKYFLFILLLSVIKSETWEAPVWGFDQNDWKNGIAGRPGYSITGFYLCGRRNYRVHYLGDPKDSWTGEYSWCDPVGLGKPIDAVNNEHDENIYDISSTFSKLKFTKLIDFNPLHPENIFPISLTLSVINFETSIDLRELQLLNISLISSTLDVSKFDISMFCRLKQPENIRCIFFTFEVIKDEILISSK